MRRPETAFGKQDSAGEPALYMGMSNRQWDLGFSDRRHKIRRVVIEARDLVALQEQIGRAKARFSWSTNGPECG
jgi:hypothetical protein